MNLPNTSGDVITEEVMDEAVEQTDDLVTDQGEDTSSEAQQERTEQPALDRPQYNIDAEVERKVNNRLPEAVKEALKDIVPQLTEAVKPKQEEYTIEQLEQFKLQHEDNPQYQAFANAKIRELERNELLKVFEEKQTKLTQQQQHQVLKQQAEMQVVNDPAYEEAFVSTPNGKNWNPNSKLAQLAGQLMSQRELADRPDGIAIAMELAYARLAKSGELKTTTKLTSVKRENQKLKKMTLTEGGGVNKQVNTKNDYQNAIERLSRTGHERDAVAAFNAYRKSRG